MPKRTSIHDFEAAIGAKKRKHDVYHSKSKTLTKKEKRRVKKQHLIQKVKQQAKHQYGSKKNKNQRHQGGDASLESGGEHLSNLRETLLPLLIESASKTLEEQKKQVKPVNPRQCSRKERESFYQQEATKFQQIVSHPIFQNDPLATIDEHISNSLALEQREKEKREAYQQEIHQMSASLANKKKISKRKKR